MNLRLFSIKALTENSVTKLTPVVCKNKIDFPAEVGMDFVSQEQANGHVLI